MNKVHSWVQKLKGKIDVVTTENAARLSSSENLSHLSPLDVQTGPPHSPAVSNDNGEAISVGAIYNSADHMAEYDIGDTVMPDSVVLSFGEAIHVLDIESTLELLSDADVTLHQPQFGELSKDIVDNILMHDEATEGKKHTLQRISNQTDDTQAKPERCKQKGSTPCPIPSVKSAIPQEQSILESCLGYEVHFPKNKREQGEHKAGSVVWTN